MQGETWDIAVRDFRIWMRFCRLSDTLRLIGTSDAMERHLVWMERELRDRMMTMQMIEHVTGTPFKPLADD